MKTSLIVVLFLVLLSPALALAEENGISPHDPRYGYPDCHLPQSPTEIEIGECARKALAVADEEMNGLYQLQMLHLTMPESKDGLRNAQRAWLRFRDQECQYEFPGAASGGMAGEDFMFCKARLTIERSNYLRYVVTDCRSNGCPN